MSSTTSRIVHVLDKRVFAFDIVGTNYQIVCEVYNEFYELELFFEIIIFIGN